MFGRRVFASAGVPRHVWASLHIQSTRQAQRILPSLAPLAALQRNGTASASSLACNALMQSNAFADILLNEDGPLPEGVGVLPLLATILSQPHNFLSPCMLEKAFRCGMLDGSLTRHEEARAQ
ncbi:hypothetical protein DQ04_05081010 [Trypanosoma grayi]|uniref:hypothetical protein n=1 Tax=Trypanosoma grayi TaxID=71804 RepID=UPI0004F489B2|nr:hypothetical protein DQ04_05081010 [Trypanosoma grayi]KEG09523.1 hypothetical protein DQ04_05081010 [Trypanosoma grayi]